MVRFLCRITGFPDPSSSSAPSTITTRSIFQNTILKDFRSRDYGAFNVIAQVAPKAKARGMDFFAWDYNNADPIMARSIPNLPQVAEIDVYGRRTTSPCFNHRTIERF